MLTVNVARDADAHVVAQRMATSLVLQPTSAPGRKSAKMKAPFWQ
jgi:hypothetical protein